MKTLKKFAAVAALSVAAVGVLAPSASASTTSAGSTAFDGTTQASASVSGNTLFTQFDTGSAASSRITITVRPFSWDWI